MSCPSASVMDYRRTTHFSSKHYHSAGGFLPAEKDIAWITVFANISRYLFGDSASCRHERRTFLSFLRLVEGF